jgi:hypothetical protein
MRAPLSFSAHFGPGAGPRKHCSARQHHESVGPRPNHRRAAQGVSGHPRSRFAVGPRWPALVACRGCWMGPAQQPRRASVPLDPLPRLIDRLSKRHAGRGSRNPPAVTVHQYRGGWVRKSISFFGIPHSARVVSASWGTLPLPRRGQTYQPRATPWGERIAIYRALKGGNNWSARHRRVAGS